MKPEALRRVLGDPRSGQVVFVSHCMLNQNVRYRGGATRPGSVDEVVARLQRAGVGIVQMPCPSSAPGVAWRSCTPCLFTAHTKLRRLRRPATWPFMLYTRLAYRRLAGQVARDIRDYVRSGRSVQAVVGVGGSPSCGVRTTLDLAGVLDTIAGCDPAQLRHRGLDVPFEEHDLIAEITR